MLLDLSVPLGRRRHVRRQPLQDLCWRLTLEAVVHQFQRLRPGHLLGAERSRQGCDWEQKKYSHLLGQVIRVVLPAQAAAADTETNMQRQRV